MSQDSSKQRKYSAALLAASTGAAVCLSGGGAKAAKVTGNITATNGKSVFSAPAIFSTTTSFNFNYHVHTSITTTTVPHYNHNTHQYCTTTTTPPICTHITTTTTTFDFNTHVHTTTTTTTTTRTSQWITSSDTVMKAFGNQASWRIRRDGSVYPLQLLGYSGTGQVNPDSGGYYAAMHAPGDDVSAAMPNGFANERRVPKGVSDKYLAVTFKLGGETRYGWLHVEASSGDGSSVQINKWGYENAGNAIKTLSDCVSAKKLSLTDGRQKLQWRNANEEGVARYEVQVEDASGAWNAIASETPGAGLYSAAAAANAGCRLVVEKVDGTTEIVPF